MHPGLALALLGAVSAFVVLRVFSGGAGGHVASCPSTVTPVAARSSLSALERVVADSGVGSLEAGGSTDVKGLQEPDATWTDGSPAPLHSGAPVDEGYELRWWSPALDHQAADLFVFPLAAEAVRYVGVAASAACRAHATSYRLAQPTGGRALAWTNPDSVREADVFFARGSDAYRLVEVAPVTYEHGPFRLDDAELIGIAQALACRLKAAACDRPGLRPALSVQGYVALEMLAEASGRLRFEPLVDAATVVGRACVLMRPLSDAQARTLYEGCQVDVHFFNVLTYALGCYGSQPCRQWAIAAAAGDLRRAASLMRQTASRLTTGACRVGWNRDATRDDELGEGLVLYGRSLLGHNSLARRQRQARAAALIRQAERTAVPISDVLEACSPHGAPLGEPQLA